MSEVEGGGVAAAAADSDADAEEGVQETLEDEMTIKRPAVTFPTCKQSERGAYRSNNKLLGINDHMAAEHNSTSLICMGARATAQEQTVSNIVTKLEPDMFFYFCISPILRAPTKL